MDNSKAKILESARNIFFSKGFSGARMQEIADKAGVNKALLNYYFRSKNKLFEAIFRDSILSLIFELNKGISAEAPIEQKIQMLIEAHNAFLHKNPQLPLFIMKELSTKHESELNLLFKLLARQIKKANIAEGMIKHLEEAMARGLIRQTDPVYLMINIVSMNIFYFAAKPLLHTIFSQRVQNWEEFEEKRPLFITELVLASLKPEVPNAP
jgi:TetR/AcrR family transcriptional regulator